MNKDLIGKIPEIEIDLIQGFAKTRVIGLTVNHEHMTDESVTEVIADYEKELGLPVTDALSRPASRLVDMVLGAFPALTRKPVQDAA